MFLYNCKREISRRKGDKFMARILISMPEKFLEEIDGVAENESRSRSELIREALRNYMRRVSKQQLLDASRNADILEDILS